MLGRLATERAGAEQVRQFGQQMVTDHWQANQERQGIARWKRIRDVPTQTGHRNALLQRRKIAISTCALPR